MSSAAFSNDSVGLNGNENSVLIRSQSPQGLYHIGHGLEGDYCGTDFSSEASRAAIASYLAAKEAGLYPAARKGGFTPDIGDEETLLVFEDDWLPLTFRLVDKTGLYNLWAHVDEINNSNIGPTQIATLRSSILDSTPSGSINPAQGIFANTNDIYGMPPDVDGNGVVDILLYDIGGGTATTVTMGYVHSGNAVLNPQPGQGNQMDILYLDSNEGTRNISTLSRVGAHEYAHLINISYGTDNTFVSEGYAEFASMLNGYFSRGEAFVTVPQEVTERLFNWRDGGGPFAWDYDRASLFFSYLNQRVGPQAIGQMMQGVNIKGGAGIDSVLAMHGENLAEIMTDYHTANLLNDQSIDPDFGYADSRRSNHHAVISAVPINGENPSDEGEGGFVHSFRQRVNAGAVYYLRFNQVANLEFVYDNPTSPVFGDAFRLDVLARNGGRVMYKRAGSSSIEYLDIEASEDLLRLDGRFDWVVFLFAHGNPDLGVGDFTTLESFWTPLSEVTDTEDIAVLPESFVLGTPYPNPFNPSTTIPFELDRGGHVFLEVVDLLGRQLEVLQDGPLLAGWHTYRLQAANWPSGTYMVRLQTESGAQTTLMTLLK